MDVQFTPEQEARLADIAGRTGKDAGALVQEAVALLLDENAKFLEAVEAGFTSLDRGEFVTHEEVGQRIERVFRP